MQNSFLTKNIDSQSFKGQFILTSEKIEVPKGWSIKEEKNWRIYTLELPALNVYNSKGLWLGWCIGHPIVHGKANPKEVILNTTSDEFEIDSINDFYLRTSGKWALLLIHTNYHRIFLDPYGSLAMVYSTIEKTIASTPSLLGANHKWDEELITKLGLTENDVWIPSGLTAKKNVRRLLPNHSLNLKEWSISRHWPTPETDLSVDINTSDLVSEIVKDIQGTIKALSNEYALSFTLTAGRDSRMVLSCARDSLNQSTFYTFSQKKITEDMHISALLASQLKLDHQFITIVEASLEDQQRWLLLTGMTVSGEILKIHKTIESLSTNRVLLTGMAGEVGRGYYWRSNDTSNLKLSALEVLTRLKLPVIPEILIETENWLNELKFLGLFPILDLMYIEQRLGCWAAPQHYGNTTSAFELTPLNSRKTFHSMLRLPYEYRKKNQLNIDICFSTWPELLRFPFNEYTGLKGYFYSNARKAKQLIKNMIGR